MFDPTQQIFPQEVKKTFLSEECLDDDTYPELHYKTFFPVPITLWQNKLECFRPSGIFEGYDISLLEGSKKMQTNARLCRKNFKGTNTLAYFAGAAVTDLPRQSAKKSLNTNSLAYFAEATVWNL